MQVATVEPQIIDQSRQKSQKDSVISKKSSEKQQLRREIQFLKEQVKKLKIDKLNERISYQSDNNKIAQFQNNIIPSVIERSSDNNQQSNQDLSILQNLNKRNERNIQSDNQNHRLIKQQNYKQCIEQPFVNFRVGRIVKNSLNNSNIKNKTQSKTIQVCKTNNRPIFILNQSSNKPLSIDNKNSDVGSELLFKTIQSRQKLNLQDDWQVIIAQTNKKDSLSNSFAKQIKQIKQQKNLFANFNDTFQSSQFSIDNNHTMRHDLSSQEQILNTNKLSKSTNLNIPDILPIQSHTKTDITGLSKKVINPEYRQYQIEDQIREKNINIRKISLKLKKDNKEKYSQTENKIQPLTYFTNSDLEKIEKHHSSRYSKHQESTADNERSRFFSTKNIPPGSRTFKSRLLNIDKLSKMQIDNECKLKPQGKIIKNIATSSLNQSQNYSPNAQNDLFIINHIPNNCFSLTQMPYIPDQLHQKSNQEEIIQMTLKIAKKLGINEIKRQFLQGIVIKKFRNCLIFKIPDINKKIIWYYEGRFYFGEGDKEGEEGYKSGEGMQYVPDKSFYKGQFLSNKKHGSGAIITAKGDIYEGQWFEGYYHGSGKFQDSQLKNIYEGEFNNGKCDGFGILKISETQIYKGTFVKNVKHGFGVELFKNGDRYKGQYEQGKFHGKGEYRWSNGSIYMGQFLMGIRTGFGEWRSCDIGGDSYVGIYFKDKKQGLGRYCWEDGSVYEGYFQKDEKHGQGLLIYKDNKSVHGRWESNKLVEVISTEQDQQCQQNLLKEECLKVKLTSNITNQIIDLQFRDKIEFIEPN